MDSGAVYCTPLPHLLSLVLLQPGIDNGRLDAKANSWNYALIGRYSLPALPSICSRPAPTTSIKRQHPPPLLAPFLGTPHPPRRPQLKVAEEIWRAQSVQTATILDTNRRLKKHTDTNTNTYTNIDKEKSEDKDTITLADPTAKTIRNTNRAVFGKYDRNLLALSGFRLSQNCVKLNNCLRKWSTSSWPSFDHDSSLSSVGIYNNNI